MIIQKRLNDLLDVCNEKKVPKITIALPTHRTVPENKQDLIVYSNLLKDVKIQLEAGFPKVEWEQTYNKLLQLKDNVDFWNNATDGLVVMACENNLELFLLNHSIKEVVSVGSHFHVQPLFMFEQLYDDYYLIDLGKDRIKIYEVGVGGFEEIIPESIKRKFSDLFDNVDSNANYNSASYSGVSGTSHGHREKSEEEDKYREKYFRYLDKEFKKMYVETGMKFILAGTTENVAAFRSFAQEKIYLDDEINKPLSSLDNAGLLKEIDKLLIPKQEETLEKLNKEIESAIGNEKFIHELKEIGVAATEGRISKLVVVDRIENKVNHELDEMISEALATGSELVVLDSESEIKHDLMAIIRY